MSDLRDLYQEVILDHSRKPRNFRVLPEARCADGHNPLCGDRVTGRASITTLVQVRKLERNRAAPR